MRKHNRRQLNKRLLLGIAALALLAFGVWLYLVLTGKNPFSSTTNNDTETPQTTSTAPTAQSDFTGGDDRPIPRNDKDEGVVIDGQGSVGTVPDKSTWTVSRTGDITLYYPAKNSVVKSGDKISGTSKLSEVSFRLIDNVNGVIAQGQLNVVNGKFSGTFSFSTTATEGRLDVFGVRDDGVEFSNIELPIRFR